jgi:hypothetical protein
MPSVASFRLFNREVEVLVSQRGRQLINGRLCVRPSKKLRGRVMRAERTVGTDKRSRQPHDLAGWRGYLDDE